MTTLTEQRRELATTLANCEPGAFPGSQASRDEWAAMTALSEFDAAHPEVLAANRAAHTESLKHSFLARGLD